jgi:hypothetical protein
MKRAPTYTEIIEHYFWHGRLKALEEIEWMQASDDLPAAIKQATASVQDNGRLFFHQRWLDEEAAARASATLLECLGEIDGTRDFHELFLLVEQLVGEIKGLKEMFVYDVAFRIGAHLRRWPTRVYLHRGTRAGAIALGFDGALPWLEVRQFPREFHILEAYLIENLLCIHKTELALAHRAVLAIRREHRARSTKYAKAMADEPARRLAVAMIDRAYDSGFWVEFASRPSHGYAGSVIDRETATIRIVTEERNGDSSDWQVRTERSVAISLAHEVGHALDPPTPEDNALRDRNAIFAVTMNRERAAWLFAEEALERLALQQDLLPELERQRERARLAYEATRPPEASSTE